MHVNMYVPFNVTSSGMLKFPATGVVSAQTIVWILKEHSVSSSVTASKPEIEQVTDVILIVSGQLPQLDVVMLYWSAEQSEFPEVQLKINCSGFTSYSRTLVGTGRGSVYLDMMSCSKL